MTTTPRWMTLGRIFMVVPVAFLVPTGVQVISSGRGPVQLAIIFSFFLWAIIWSWLWLRVVGRDHTGEVVGFAAQVVVLSMFTLVQPAPIGSLMVFAFIIAGAIFPIRQVGWAFAALLIIEGALQFIRQNNPSITINLLLNDAVVGGTAAVGRAMVISYLGLMAAREEIARLAVSEERLRFARDLHDLLGQSLAVVVLKSELVAKQLPPETDESLRQELRDVARVARKSLNDVREAVGGYHRPSLTAEIANARNALRAAGIGFKVADELGRVPAEQDAVLAWCVREGVTNVVKHSGASQCVLHLARESSVARLELEDDGRGAGEGGGGSGLAGLQERVELAGGDFEVETSASHGFRLRVLLPAGVPVASELAAS